MRITIVQGAFYPVPPVLGGAIEKAWFVLGREFSKRGHQVTHISRCYGDFPKESMTEGVRHLRIKGFDAPKSLFLLKWWDLLYSRRVLKVLPPADILITNTFWLPMLVRDRQQGDLYVHVGRNPKGQIKYYKRATRFQVPSQATAEEIIQQEPWSREKVRVIPYPLTEGVPIKEEEGKENQILYVGRIHKEKGISLLLEAFHRLVRSGVRDWQLVLVGSWESKFGGSGKKYYQMLRKKYREIDDKVHWAGPVLEPLPLGDYYRKAKLFVYPSLAQKGETFGLAVLEAMSYGCPPLVSDLDCFKDFVKEGQTGFIFNHGARDPVAALTERLKELVHAEDKLRETAKRSFEAAKDYSVERVADIFLSDFQSVIKHE